MLRIPNRLTCSNALRLGLHGKWHNRLAKKKLKRITSFSAATGSFSFCPFCTFTGEEELAGTTEEVTVGLKMINGRYRDVNVTLTAVAATLEPVVFFSVLFFFIQSLQRSSTPVRPGNKRSPPAAVLSTSVRTHGSFSPAVSGLGTLLRLGVPTEAMRLPQLNTCYPPRHRLLGGVAEREGSCSALTRAGST